MLMIHGGFEEDYWPLLHRPALSVNLGLPTVRSFCVAFQLFPCTRLAFVVPSLFFLLHLIYASKH